MEQSNEQDKKKLNDDLVVYMRKRSDHDTPRYTARLKTYVNIQRKRRRAIAARRAVSEQSNEKTPSGGLRKKSDEQKDKNETGLMALTVTESADPEKQANLFSGKYRSDAINSEDGGRISSRKSLPSQHRVNSKLYSVMTSSSDSDAGWFDRRGAEEKPARRSISQSRSDGDQSDACCRRRRRRCCPRRRRRCCRRRRRRCRRRRRRPCCCRRRPRCPRRRRCG